MDIILIMGIVIFSYIGSLLATLYGKKEPKEAFIPGTLTWIGLIVFSFFVPLEVIFASAIIILMMAVALGILIKIALPKEKN